MIVGIILSAGESKRMGTPKQLLPWGEKIILQQVVDNAQNSRLDEVLLVLGSRADEIQAKISISSKTRIVINPNFKEGMSSSVKIGVQNAPETADAFLLLLGDQPFISAEIIDKVISSYQTTGHSIVRPVYKGGHGHPIIFSAQYRQELLNIGEGGAKVVVNNHLADIYELPLDIPEILTDIDTPLDYQNALNKTKRQK